MLFSTWIVLDVSYVVRSLYYVILVKLKLFPRIPFPVWLLVKPEQKIHFCEIRMQSRTAAIIS